MFVQHFIGGGGGAARWHLLTLAPAPKIMGLQLFILPTTSKGIENLIGVIVHVSCDLI